jgi:uncharacterized protein YdgA (DUF945 family)
MKKVLIGLAVLGLAYPLGVWIMGFAIDARFQRAIEEGTGPVSQLKLLHHERHGLFGSDDDSTYAYGSIMKIERHYHRGWYRSTDDVTVFVQSPLASALQPTALGRAAPQTPYPTFSVNTVVHHGPFCGKHCFALAGFESQVELVGPVGLALKSVFGGAAPLSISGRLEFSGASSASYSSPPVSGVALGQGTQLYWSGLEGTTNVAPHNEAYEMHLIAPRLRIHGEKGVDLDLQGLSLEAESKRALRTLYTGDANFKVASLSFGAPAAAAPSTLSDLRFGMSSDLDGRFMRVRYQWGTGPLVDPRLSLSSAHLDFTFQHLELEALANLTDAFRAASQQQDPTAPPAARASALMGSLKQPLQALLASDPEWDIDRISMANAQGQALITGVIRWPGLTSADFSPAAGGAALGKLDITIKVTLDEAFLKSLPGSSDIDSKLQPMIDQGFLKRSAGALHSEIRMAGGVTTVNGKPFNAGALAPGGLAPRSPNTPPALSPRAPGPLAPSSVSPTPLAPAPSRPANPRAA